MFRRIAPFPSVRGRRLVTNLPRLGMVLLALAGAAAAGPVATERHYLSGRGPDDAVEWDFKVSEGRRSGEWTKIRVPSVWEQQGFGTYNYGIRYYGKPNPPGIAREQGIYRHRFRVPREWQQRRVRLVFEGAMTDTHVRLNGISMGPAHQGGFYRFSHEITQWLVFGGENHLEITVDKESANSSVNLAERRADYWNFGGIFRPVWLEVLPARFIDRVAVDADADGSFLAEVHLGDAAAGAGTRVTAQVFDAAGAPAGEAFHAEVAPGSDRAVLRSTVRSPQRWTAETPTLYEARFTLHPAGDGGDIDSHQVTQRFGFRTFEVRAGEGLFLNGRRILLKGINRHSFRPETGRSLSREDNYEDARLLKELNLNAVRLSHYPPDPAFLDACDELGLYVINELGGWHGAYDTGVGRPLVRAMVTRDVNHPSILFWANGNEGGWNPELDPEFARWDPQRRPVLHPQQDHDGVETMHYRSYGETQEYLRGHDIYLPTEFLHGLYDGGHGAGLWDYWEMMRQHPRAGGGFLWVLADEGLVRTDQGGRIDTVGNYGADGIVGPHHEKEGSFFTVREIWSPVQVSLPGADGRVFQLPPDFDGALEVENRFDFTSLEQCRFRWELARFPGPETTKPGHQTLAAGELAGLAVAPGERGRLQLPLDGAWRDADALYVTAIDHLGAALWTWSWSRQPAGTVTEASARPAPGSAAPRVTETTDAWLIQAGEVEWRFSKSTGELAGVRRAGGPLSLGAGPRFIAARRGDRSVDGWIDAEAAKGADRVYRDISPESRLRELSVRADGAAARVQARYDGALRTTEWVLRGDGRAQLDYTYQYDGVVELMGVHFAYPEEQMREVRWLGRGPYRVWQNRRHGTVLDVWSNPYVDPVPGESFLYPEFKGYFEAWHWATFLTSEGRFTLTNRTPGSFLGLYTPRDGRDALLYTLPATGLGVFDVIPAVRNKVNATDLIGPSSLPQRVSGLRRGSLEIDLRER